MSACVLPRNGLVSRPSGTSAMARGSSPASHENRNGGSFSEGLVERVFLFLSTFVVVGLTFLAGVLRKLCGGEVPVPSVCTGVSPPLMNILVTVL